MEWKEAVWLGVPESEIRKHNILQGDMNGRFAYYRCEADFKEIFKENLEEGSRFKILITANSRYRLWVNGSPVLSGPCKGDRYRHYYEEADITEYLKAGKNVLAVQVLFCDPNAVTHQYEDRAPIFAVASLPVGHMLAVEGRAEGPDGEVLVDVTTGRADWKVYLDGSRYLKSQEASINFGAVSEEIDFRKQPGAWKGTGYDDSGWAVPRKMGTAVITDFDRGVGLYGALRLKKREIPLLFEEEGAFLPEKNPTVLIREGKLVIPAGSREEIVLDAGVHTNAYPRFAVEKGRGASISIMYSEKYSSPGREIRRTDRENGELTGLTDTIVLDGSLIVYEPFWYRTFRFIKIEVQAADEDVILYAPGFKRTGYPLTVRSEIKASEDWVEKLWDICLRTLQNCMTETYMDCPYYEQMQFSMDTRLQALFTYAVSGDVRLARKALEDFHCSRIPDGLIQGKYPSAFPQIISTFSLHYIYMIEEYCRQTGDMQTARRYRADVDDILEYYDRKIGKDGLAEHLGYWEFVDWQEAWKENMGVPTAAQAGPSTIINLMYAYALKSAAWICEATGRKGMAEEYLSRQKAITDRIQELCWDREAGLYREGPHTVQYSQHAQAWAVLNGMADKKQAKEILRRTLDDPKVLQCSFSTGYELFRAFEWAEDYGATRMLMEKWMRLLDWECTTCPEEPENGRSDCHAWSALPLFEFMRSIAGIRMGEDGWKSVIVTPHLEYVGELSGKAVIPGGIVKFHYDRDKGVYEVTLPEGIGGKLILPDGKVREI